LKFFQNYFVKIASHIILMFLVGMKSFPFSSSFLAPEKEITQREPDLAVWGGGGGFISVTTILRKKSCTGALSCAKLQITHLETLLPPVACICILVGLEFSFR
jgi:hypothetical protein